MDSRRGVGQSPDMTALGRYQLLEASGGFSERPGEPPHEVLVKFGDATLTILRFDETPLAHWPLASIHMTEEGRRAVVAPDATAPERLELDDPQMIDALRSARRPPAHERSRASRRALRIVGAVAALAIAAVGLWRATPALLDRMATSASPAARAALGEAAILVHAGPTLCVAAPGLQALSRLEARLSSAAGAPVRLAVADLPAGASAAPAPGGWVLLTADALRAAEGPDEVAASAAGAVETARSRNPTGLALREAGLSGLAGAVSGRFDAVRLTAAAAAALERALGSPEPAPAAGGIVAALPSPVLDAADWAALRAICLEKAARR